MKMKIAHLGTQSELCEYSHQITSLTGNEVQQGLR